MNRIIMCLIFILIASCAGSKLANNSLESTINPAIYPPKWTETLTSTQNNSKDARSTQVSPTITVVNNSPLPRTFEGFILYNGRCDKYNCLFTSKESKYLVLGLATISGFYTSIQKTAWNETKQCDNFVITGGNTGVIDYILFLIDEANTVNTINEIGQPIINIDVDSLSQEKKQILFSSTNKKPISLTLVSTLGIGTEVPVCFSFFSIIEVYDHDIYKK
jgi:hypothetical protein